MKKGWWIALGLLLVGLVGTAIWYSRLRKVADPAHEPVAAITPKVTINSVNISNIDSEAVSLLVSMTVDNPLPVAFRAQKLRYTAFVARTPVLTEAYPKPIVVL